MNFKNEAWIDKKYWNKKWCYYSIYSFVGKSLLLHLAIVDITCQCKDFLTEPCCLHHKIYSIQKLLGKMMLVWANVRIFTSQPINLTKLNLQFISATTATGHLERASSCWLSLSGQCTPSNSKAKAPEPIAQVIGLIHMTMPSWLQPFKRFLVCFEGKSCPYQIMLQLSCGPHNGQVLLLTCAFLFFKEQLAYSTTAHVRLKALYQHHIQKHLLST